MAKGEAYVSRAKEIIDLPLIHDLGGQFLIGQKCIMHYWRKYG